jgi:hypothetical protein
LVSLVENLVEVGDHLLLQLGIVEEVDAVGSFELLELGAAELEDYPAVVVLVLSALE